jgi:3-oxoacyl-[acyl-carrier-protein] synthase II
MDYAIANGFGFGGVNASALFRRWTGNDPGFRNIASRQ